jgi:hypothetical protein
MTAALVLLSLGALAAALYLIYRKMKEAVR